MSRLAKPLPNTVTIYDALSMWQNSLAAADRSPKTLRTYAYAGAKLTDCVGTDREVGSITRAEHERLFAGLKALGLSESTRVVVFRALRTFWTWAVRHEDLPVSKNPMAGMDQPKVTVKLVEFVTDAELRAIVATCKPKSRSNFRGCRDEALIRVLAGSGARLSEVTNLTLADVDLPGHAVRVLGKGRTERWVPLDDAAAAALRRYLERERARHSDATTTDRLWLGPKGSMTPSGIAQMLAERAKAAGVARRVHPHELRHRFVATTLNAGLSEGDVMSLTGHRTRSMLDRYGAFTRAQRAQEAYQRATASGAIPRL